MNKTEVDSCYNYCDDELPGASFHYDKAVILNDDAQEQIRQFCGSHLLGPLLNYISNEVVKQNDLPAAFLHMWAVGNLNDARKLKDFCLKKEYQVPSIIVHGFVDKMYSTDDLMKDRKANPDSIERLNEIHPTVANILIDYFNAHERSKQFNGIKYLCVRTYITNFRSDYL